MIIFSEFAADYCHLAGFDCNVLWWPKRIRLPLRIDTPQISRWIVVIKFPFIYLSLTFTSFEFRKTQTDRHTHAHMPIRTHAHWHMPARTRNTTSHTYIRILTQSIQCITGAPHKHHRNNACRNVLWAQPHAHTHARNYADNCDHRYDYEHMSETAIDDCE